MDLQRPKVVDYVLKKSIQLALIFAVLALLFTWQEVSLAVIYLLVGGIIATMFAYSIQNKRWLSASIAFVAHLVIPLSYIAIFFGCALDGDCGIGTLLLWLSLLSLIAADFYFSVKAFKGWLGTLIVFLMWAVPILAFPIIDNVLGYLLD